MVLYKLKFNRKSFFFFACSVGFWDAFLNIFPIAFNKKKREENSRRFEPGNVNNHPHTKCYVYCISLWLFFLRLKYCRNPINRVSKLPMDIFLTVKYLRNLVIHPTHWHILRFRERFVFCAATLLRSCVIYRRFKLNCIETDSDSNAYGINDHVLIWWNEAICFDWPYFLFHLFIFSFELRQRCENSILTI